MLDGQRRTRYFMISLRKNRIAYAYASAIALLLLAVAFGMLLGPSRLSPSDILSSLARGDKDSPELRILLYVRLPRMLSGLVCGAALAVSGAVIQGVLANRLASPSIIGVNSGAGLAVTLCSALGIMGGWMLSMFAFIGAFLSVMLVSLGAKRWGASRGTVILMGVALNALLGAISDLIVTFSPDISVMNSDFRIGDFSSATYDRLIPASFAVLAAITVLLTLSNELDVLTLGDDNARGLGMNTDVMRVVFLLLSALLAGVAVSIAGLLSFVGLLVPHAVRRIASSQTRCLLPLCALFGAGFVSLCDTFARIVFAPYELPVGIIMAFLGAPFFIFIILRKRGGHSRD